MGNIHLTGPSIMSNVPLTNNNKTVYVKNTMVSTKKVYSTTTYAKSV